MFKAFQIFRICFNDGGFSRLIHCKMFLAKSLPGKNTLEVVQKAIRPGEFKRADF